MSWIDYYDDYYGKIKDRKKKPEVKCECGLDKLPKLQQCSYGHALFCPLFKHVDEEE